MVRTALLTVRATASWVSAWFVVPMARPVVVLDGREHAATWGAAVRLPVAPGPHTVAVGIRYRGSRRLLGLAPTVVSLAAGEARSCIARNGVLNSEPFRLREV